jgi:CHASE3 domain sensor protein
MYRKKKFGEEMSLSLIVACVLGVVMVAASLVSLIRWMG